MRLQVDFMVILAGIVVDLLIFRGVLYFNVKSLEPPVILPRHELDPAAFVQGPSIGHIRDMDEIILIVGIDESVPLVIFVKLHFT